MIEFLSRQGFSVTRARGSHHVMQRDNLWTTVPVHGNQTLKIGTLRKILRDVELSPSEFAELWFA